MAYVHTLKGLPQRVFRSVMAMPVLPECIAAFTHSDATIFMAHRFRIPELGIAGHDPQNLRQTLTQLRKRRYDLISIEEVFRRIREHEPLKRAVAFTIDDGYCDVGQIAAPIFSEFDCPVTVFTITGFLDGNLWLWWDKIAYIFTETKRVEIRARLGGEHLHFRLDTECSRGRWRELVTRCYQASEEEKLACIRELSSTSDVELPDRPPERFRSISWDEARRLEGKGVSFGPHTLTHPVLSTVPAEQSEREIMGSWERLRTEVSRPVPIFCYPGGEPYDFGEREIATMRRLGLRGAVTGEPGNIHPGFGASANEWYRVPRYLYQDTLSSVLQRVSGMEGIKARLRGNPTRRKGSNG